jgi:hypothetical protein
MAPTDGDIVEENLSFRCAPQGNQVSSAQAEFSALSGSALHNQHRFAGE